MASASHTNHSPFAVVDEDAQSSPEIRDTDTRTRKLKLRKHRFKGIPVPSAHPITSSSPPSDRYPSSPPSNEQVRVSDIHSYTPNVLQERQNTNHLVRSSNACWSPTSPKGDLPEIDENSSPGKDRRSSIPVKIHKTRSSRTSLAPRRSVSGIEASKYIEHLESQLASLQTQLTSFTSPSQTRTQSSKLRALNAESQLLRQEVTEWESKFNERIEEQLEQHQILVDSLRSQIRKLESTNDEQHARISELQTECEERCSYAEGMESANYELERRLEFMSELLATSPNKVDLHHPASAMKPMRPRSIQGPRINTNIRPMSPESKRFSRSVIGYGAPSTPGARCDSRASDMSSIGNILFPSSSSVPDINDRDLDGTTEYETGDDTLMETTIAADAPVRAMSWMRPKMAESLVQSPPKTKPSRRMRRFYTGSQGPRALILPVTTHAGSHPISAPIPQTPSPPSRSHATNRHSISEFPLFKDAESPQLPSRPIHRRNATWDVDDIPIQNRRRLDSSPLLGHSFQSNLSASIEQAKVENDRLRALQVLSSDSERGGNLEDELARARRESSVFSASRPGTMDGQQTLRARRHDDDARLSPAYETQEDRPAEGKMTLYSEFPHGRTRLELTPGALVRKPGSVFRLLNMICVRTLDGYTMNARRMFQTAWSGTVLSRPVVEFRMWLIRLLLNGLQKKNSLEQENVEDTLAGTSARLQLEYSQRDTAGLERGGPGHAVHDSEGLQGLAYGEISLPALNSQQRSGLAKGPVNWIKFGVTLIFAVGIAIKDGPSSLFGDGSH